MCGPFFRPPMLRVHTVTSPKHSEPCGDDLRVSLPEFAEPAHNARPSRVSLPNCSTVASDRCPSNRLGISFYIRIVHHQPPGCHPLHGKVPPERPSLTLTQDLGALRFRQPFLFFRVVIEPLCFMPLTQHGPKHRRLRKSSRCHPHALVKRSP